MSTAMSESHPGASELLPHYASHIEDRTILMLGASPQSLGARFLSTINSARPKLIILVGRSESKALEVSSLLVPTATKFVHADMLSLASVRSAAAAINAMDARIDVVINSAGLGAVDYALSQDGVESSLQASHLGFWLLANLVMPKLIEAGGARVVNISSEGYSLGPVRYLDPTFYKGEVFNPFLAYGQSKSAQILFASALATRLGHRGILSYSVQPGYTPGTNLGGGGPIDPEARKKRGEAMALQLKVSGIVLPPGDGLPTEPDISLANYLVAAFDPELAKHNGAYIRRCKVIDKDTMAPWAVDERQERRCWAFSEQLVGQKFGYD